MKETEEKKSCLTCINVNCKVPYNEKLGLDKNGNPEGYNCIGYKGTLEIKGFSKVLKK